MTTINSIVNNEGGGRGGSSTTRGGAAHHHRPAKWEETSLFFLSAVGCTLGWTAVLSNLVYYTNTLGVQSYVVLNLCIYAPLFPITIAQTLFDADFDRRFSSITSFWVRGSVGFGVTLLSTILLALGNSKKDSLLTVSLLSLSLGTSSGILHGSLKQMASFVYPGCGRLAAAVTAGLQASAVFVLVVTIFTPGSVTATSSNNRWLRCFYGTISVLVALCWCGYQRLMTHSRDVYRSMIRRDSSIQLSSLGSSVSSSCCSSSDEEEEDDCADGIVDREDAISYHQADDLLATTSSPPAPAPLLAQSPSTDSQEMERQQQQELTGGGGGHDDDTMCCSNNNNGNSNSQQPPFWMLSPMTKLLIRQSWPLCVAIFLTVASSMAVSSWFNRVPSTSKHHPEILPQVLFYTRLFADLLARPATLLLPTNNRNHNNNPQQANDKRVLWYLLGLVGLRLIFVPYFFLYCTTSSMFPRSDCFMTLGVFAFAGSSGFITTWVYQLAPQYCRSIVSPIETSEHQSLLQQHEDNDDDELEGQQQQQQQQTEGNALLLLQQTNLLNVCFSASILLGLIGSFVLSSMKMADDGATTAASAS